MTIIGGMVNKKSMIFKVFGVYLSEFLIFLREIFFDSKILSSCSDKHHNFDSGCSSYPGANNQYNADQIFVKSALLSGPYKVLFSVLLIRKTYMVSV